MLRACPFQWGASMCWTPPISGRHSSTASESRYLFVAVVDRIVLPKVPVRGAIPPGHRLTTPQGGGNPPPHPGGRAAQACPRPAALVALREVVAWHRYLGTTETQTETRLGRMPHELDCSAWSAGWVSCPR